MSEQESNICEKCGGIKVKLLVHGGQRVCQGHPDPHPPHKYCPKCGLWKDLDGIRCRACGTTLVLRRLDEQTEPAPKHDGKLDEDGEIEVEMRDRAGAIIMLSKPGQDDLVMSPAQALSLLAWLEQEREELQRLAKEQGEATT